MAWATAKKIQFVGKLYIVFVYKKRNIVKFTDKLYFSDVNTVCWPANYISLPKLNLKSQTQTEHLEIHHVKTLKSCEYLWRAKYHERISRYWGNFWKLECILLTTLICTNFPDSWEVDTYPMRQRSKWIKEIQHSIPGSINSSVPCAFPSTIKICYHRKFNFKCWSLR